jgi:hypothetical protein
MCECPMVAAEVGKHSSVRVGEYRRFIEQLPQQQSAPVICCPPSTTRLHPVNMSALHLPTGSRDISGECRITVVGPGLNPCPPPLPIYPPSNPLPVPPATYPQPPPNTRIVGSPVYRKNDQQYVTVRGRSSGTLTARIRTISEQQSILPAWYHAPANIPVCNPLPYRVLSPVAPNPCYLTGTRRVDFSSPLKGS